MRNLYFVQIEIQEENPAAVSHDMDILRKADKMDWTDCGWEDLQRDCQTSAAKDELHTMMMHKYHSDEYSHDML